MLELVDRILHIPSVSSKIINQWDNILIDEAQDTTTRQWNILRPFMFHTLTSLICFDENQAIYLWNGADTEFLRNYLQLPSAVVYSLSESFRSPNKITTFVNQLVPNGLSFIKTEKLGGTVSIDKYESIEKEALAIIKKLTPDSSIIARTNNYLIEFEKQLILNNIKYKGDGIFSHSSFSKYISQLKASTHPLYLIKEIGRISFANDDERRAQKVIETYLDKGVTVEELESLSNKSLELYGDNVTLSTGHASKGKEWKTTFVVGVNNKMLPHYKSTNLKEEKNLAYVMVTRAKENLFISYVGTPSPFIEEFIN